MFILNGRSCERRFIFFVYSWNTKGVLGVVEDRVLAAWG